MDGGIQYMGERLTHGRCWQFGLQKKRADVCDFGRLCAERFLHRGADAIWTLMCFISSGF